MTDPFTDDPYVAAHPENLPFWTAAESDVFLGKACVACRQFHWIPRVVCPFCRSFETEWKPLSGRGEIHAFSTLRRADPPYTVAYVQLAEGPIVLTNLVDVEVDRLRIGLPVRVVFRRTEEGRKAPKFTLE